jgi:hypothetical protein
MKHYSRLRINNFVMWRHYSVYFTVYSVVFLKLLKRYKQSDTTTTQRSAEWFARMLM